MRYRLAACTLLLTLQWPLTAAADVYRCTGGGTVEYTDKPCAAGSEPVELGRPAAIADRPQARMQLDPPRDYRPPREPARRRLEVDTTPDVDCPSDKAIEQALRRREIATCMTPAQVRRATPPRISNHEVRQSFDQFGSFTEWRYPVVTDGWPARIQFRDGKVFGFETLPYRARD